MTAFLVLTAVTACTDSKEKINWTDLTSLRLYEHTDKDKISLTDSDIEKMKFVEVGIDEVQFFLNQSTPIGKKAYLWKGSYLAIATFKDGQKKKLKISCYGGFFMDITTKEYYEIKNETWRNGWDSLCAEYNKELYATVKTTISTADTDFVVIK
jgi:hypothetical protein